MEAIHVLQNAKEENNIRRKKGSIPNILFVGVISIFTAFLTGFILFAITMVLMKGLPNFWSSIQTAEVQFALKLSLFTSIVSTLLCGLFALPISYGIARLNFKGKQIVNMILGIPMSLPPIVSGVALLLLFGNTSLGHMFANWGLKFVFTVKGIILAQFFVNVPYMIRILKSTIEDIDPRIEYVSRTLGCSQVQAFLKITVPLAVNGWIASIIITWAKALGEFGAVVMIAGATRMKTETLPISLYLNMSCGELDLAMTSAAILIVISILSLLIFELLGMRSKKGKKHAAY
jgi:molybdate transport system permease protein